MARKAVSADAYRFVGTFERLRNRLLNQADDGRLDKQLRYWVLPEDRRLPIAFLDKPVRELLEMPFDDLLATPGVGRKKIMGLFDLLKRVAKSTTTDEPFGLSPNKKSTRAATAAASGFDPSKVSEALWTAWCDSVRRHDFGNHRLGRLAPSLQALPTVIWNTRLNEYVDRSLMEIRRLKTHGEKRVHAILEVFCVVHEAVATAICDENLELELLPRFVPGVSRWLIDVLEEEKPPTTTELRRQLTSPLVAQIEIDLGPHVAKIAGERLQLDGRAPSVKDQADEMGVTRARVYQLLDDCARVMEVRWPEGRWLLAPLGAKLAHAGTRRSQALLEAALELFYPEQEGCPAVAYAVAEA